jgi:DNA-binding MarR family transcriptional regulator
MKRIILNDIITNYYINENGEVFNKKFKLIKPRLNKGYFSFSLRINNQYKNLSLHRLLAMVFLENKNKYPFVRHLNDVKTDNRLSNLAWGGYEENLKDAQLNKKILKGIDKPNVKLKEKDVEYIFVNPDQKTMKELSNIFNISIGSVSRIQKGRVWTHITKGLTPKWRSLKNGRGMYEYRIS